MTLLGGFDFYVNNCSPLERLPLHVVIPYEFDYLFLRFSAVPVGKKQSFYHSAKKSFITSKSQHSNDFSLLVR